MREMREGHIPSAMWTQGGQETEQDTQRASLPWFPGQQQQDNNREGVYSHFQTLIRIRFIRHESLHRHKVQRHWESTDAEPFHYTHTHLLSLPRCLHSDLTSQQAMQPVSSQATVARQPTSKAANQPVRQQSSKAANQPARQQSSDSSCC